MNKLRRKRETGKFTYKYHIIMQLTPLLLLLEIILNFRQSFKIDFFLSSASAVSETLSFIDDDDKQQPGHSASKIEESVANLSAVFPGIPLSVIRNAVVNYGNADRAVNALLSYRSTGESGPESSGFSTWDAGEAAGIAKSGSLSQVLRRLRSKMYSRGMREKIKIDADDEVMDVYSYYKSPHFDPLTPVSMVVKGQPAIDTGGVLRQVFSEVFLSIINNEGGIKNVFTGEDLRKVPVFSNELVVNGFFEVLGKMIAHSLVQCGPGFPYLAPSIYWYLVTGDLQVAIEEASRCDISNNDLVMYIDQVHTCIYRHSELNINHMHAECQNNYCEYDSPE